MMNLNNPLFQLIQVMNSGGNPQSILNSLAQSNPQIRNVMQMMNGKDANQLRQMAENMAHERGTTVEQVSQSLGLNLPN